MEDGSTGPIGALLVIIVFLVLNGILFAFSAALNNADETEVEEKAGEGDKKSIRLLKVIDEPLLFVQTLYSVTVLSAVILSFVSLRYFSELLKETILAFFPSFAQAKTVSYVLVVWASLTVLLALCCLLPKKLARQHPNASLYRTVSFVHFLVLLLKPVTVPQIGLANALLRLLGVDPHKTGDVVTEGEIISIVDEANEHGVIKKNEAEMIQNIMAFGDTTARDVMTHRNQIAAIDGNAALDEAVDFMLKGRNSRYPVYSGNIDNICGIIHFKDAMNEYTRHPENKNVPITDITSLIREAAIFPETRSIESIFQYMRTQKVHLAVVVDEYGQTSGVVAMEDILEEIVGSILDEYDADDPFIQREFDDSIIMDGLTPLEKAGEVLHYDFSGEEYETLNGYLTGMLGHIPSAKDKMVTGKKFLFRILKVENHTIKKVRIERLPKKKGEEPCQDIQNSQT
ncbi:MAG TPA: hemolysin family protein [Lachnospiraceae bacterium]|nr:hemolysin family protein [Lachnospiraceae bacterium]